MSQNYSVSKLSAKAQIEVMAKNKAKDLRQNLGGRLFRRLLISFFLMYSPCVQAKAAEATAQKLSFRFMDRLQTGISYHLNPQMAFSQLSLTCLGESDIYPRLLQLPAGSSAFQTLSPMTSPARISYCLNIWSILDILALILGVSACAGSYVDIINYSIVAASERHSKGHKKQWLHAAE